MRLEFCSRLQQKTVRLPNLYLYFNFQGYGDPVEYHDSSLCSGAVDVDHRGIIPGMGDLGKLIEWKTVTTMFDCSPCFMLR